MFGQSKKVSYCKQCNNIRHSSNESYPELCECCILKNKNKDIPVMPKKIVCYECGEFAYNEEKIRDNFHLFKSTNGLYTHYLCSKCLYGITTPKPEKEDEEECN